MDKLARLITITFLSCLLTVACDSANRFDVIDSPDNSNTSGVTGDSDDVVAPNVNTASENYLLAQHVTANRPFDIKQEQGTIRFSDGVETTVLVSRPDDDFAYPVMVLPSSFVINYLQYSLISRRLAEMGVIAVTFTSRGTWEAGGELELADKRTVTDISEVIDWAIVNYPVDSKNIAVGGVSYAAGLGLLSAARDERVKTVISLAGWTDMQASLYFNDTVSTGGRALVDWRVRSTTRIGPVFNRILEEMEQGIFSFEALTRLMPERSPIYYLDQLNRNRPAVLQINNWDDEYFPTTQLFDFYNEYQGPHRLHLTNGDAHIDEYQSGLLGLSNENWSLVYDWLDQHLLHLSINNGLKGGVFAIKNTDASIQINDTSDLPVEYSNYYLVGDNAGVNTLAMAPGAGTLEWIAPLAGGIDTGSNTQLGDVFETTATPSIQSDNGAAVWRSNPLIRDEIVLGQVSMKLNITPSSPDSTIILYLYDEDPSGQASVIAHAPFSQSGIAPGDSTYHEIFFHTTNYAIDSGHSLVISIDTDDDGYLSLTDEGEDLSISSTIRKPALASIPFYRP